MKQKSKRYWTWTRKQKQKSKSPVPKYQSTIPADFTRAYHGKARGKDKKALLDELNGKDGIFMGRTHRNSAQWDF